MVSKEIIKLVPKVELHEHMDGSMRPRTVAELARENHVALPTYDVDALAEFFATRSKDKSLARYLEMFDYTLAVLQTPEALERAAYEDILDLAAQNVVYAEVRFAPNLHREKGLSMEEIVVAVLRGLETGRRQTGTEFGLILCAMRDQDPAISLKVAELAVAFRDRGVVGFDIAGREQGFPPKKHIEAFNYIRKKNFNLTIHAGEAFGVESIWQAIQVCGAQRIGHGICLLEDMAVEGTKVTRLGALSQFVLDKRIPLEQCISSNVGTGAARSYATHPFDIFFRNNFRVFLCSDNRLMSDTNLTHEMEIAVDSFNYNIRDLEKITINAMKSSFIHHNEKIRIIYDVIKKRYLEIRNEFSLN